MRELNDKLKALPEASRSFQELKTAFELLKQWEEGKRRLAGEQSALQKAEEILEQSRVKLSALQESLERAQQRHGRIWRGIWPPACGMGSPVLCAVRFTIPVRPVWK